MIVDSIKAKGLVSFVLTDEQGNIKDQQTHNMVVNTGLSHIAKRLYSSPTAMSHMAVGTGTTAEAETQETLISQLAIVGLDSSSIATTTVTDDTVQYVATFGTGVGTGAITEAGIFNAETGGVMLARTKFDVINKGDGDTLTITWKVTIA